jgi:hypothetical protein
MLYSEIIAVCSEIYTKHINALCGQNVQFASVKPGGTYSNHWALNTFCVSGQSEWIKRTPLPSTHHTQHYHLKDAAAWAADSELIWDCTEEKKLRMDRANKCANKCIGTKTIIFTVKRSLA